MSPPLLSPCPASPTLVLLGTRRRDFTGSQHKKGLPPFLPFLPPLFPIGRAELIQIRVNDHFPPSPPPPTSCKKRARICHSLFKKRSRQRSTTKKERKSGRKGGGGGRGEEVTMKRLPGLLHVLPSPLPPPSQLPVLE